MESIRRSGDRGRVPATARSKLDAAHAALTAKLGRPPTIVELSTAIGVSYERTRQVVLSRSAELEREIPITPASDIKQGPRPLRGRRCVLGRIPCTGATESLVVRNLQRVYADVIAKPNAPTDAELAAAVGYSRRPDQNALEFRRYIEGTRIPSLELLGRIAAALGVHVGELLRPL